MKKKVEAKNNLEGYCFQVKNSLNDEKVKDKVSAEDKELINKECDSTVDWISSNQ